MRLLREKSVGLVLRAFSPKLGLVWKTVGQVAEVISVAEKLQINDVPVFQRIDVMVACDERYVDYDCGATAKELAKLDFQDHVHIHEVYHGDLYCGLLNAGFYHQIRANIDYAMNLSHGVLSYLTEESVGEMLTALANGARATGLAIEPFADSIMEGRLLDTCDIWHLESWMRIGGYDIRGAQPRTSDRSRGWVRDTVDGDDSEWSYETAGVEEMIPLINLVHLYGPCIAPIKPRNAGTWVIPDDPAVQAREEKKIRTKYDRQVRAAAMEGVNLSFLKSGIMPGYTK